MTRTPGEDAIDNEIIFIKQNDPCSTQYPLADHAEKEVHLIILTTIFFPKLERNVISKYENFMDY